MLSDLERRCDVLVVGAGLSGCAAAVKAFREGADVLVIESKKEPEITGGHRTSFEALQNLVQDDDPLDFLGRIGLKVESEIPYTGAVIHSPSGEKIDMRLRRKHGYFVRRKGPSSIDHQVVRRVKDLGIKILFGCRLDSIHKGNRVRVSLNGVCGEIIAGTVIGADGKGTTAGKGIAIPLGSRDLALGMGLQFRGEHGFEPGVAEVWLGSRICPGEYSYVLASEDEVSVVTTMRPHLIRDGLRPRDLLSNFIKIPDIAERLRGVQERSQIVGCVPVSSGGPLGRGRVLLVGEAARLTDPLLGFGMNNAFRSGYLAGGAVSSEFPLDIYSALVEEHIIKDLKRRMKVRIKVMDRMEDTTIDRMVSIAGDLLQHVDPNDLFDPKKRTAAALDCLLRSGIKGGLFTAARFLLPILYSNFSFRFFERGGKSSYGYPLRGPGDIPEKVKIRNATSIY